MEKQNKKILIIGGEGYLGSALLHYLTQKKYSVDSVDLEWFGYFHHIHNKKIDYRSLEKEDLHPYSVIIYLAGYSSNSLCNKEPLKSFDNNVIGFHRLLKCLDHQKFIYASSSTLYKSLGEHLHTEESVEFDIASLHEFFFYSIDRLAQLSNKQIYGLRLGSVNGPSPNMRTDLILNRMVQQAQQKEKVSVSFPDVYRPILGISDFCRCIEILLLKSPPKGLYNLASFNISTLELGNQIAEFFKVPMEKYHADPTFNLCIDTDKFQKVLGFHFKDTLSSIIHQLISDKNQHYFDQRTA